MSAKKASSKPYHHGNLKEEFIEKGLEYIDKYGIENLSMRKLAESIGVSSAAPYAHFRNKEAFLDSIQEHITESLTEALKNAYDSCENMKNILVVLGVRYVLFFYENPLYYQFLFTRSRIDLNSFPPFIFYKEIAAEALKRIHQKRLTKETIRKKTLTMWATAHGIAQFAIMEGVLNTDDLAKEIEQLLWSVDV